MRSDTRSLKGQVFVTLDEAAMEFEFRLQAASSEAKVRVLKGASNSPTKIEDGFRIGIWNFERSGPGTQPQILGNRLIVPSDRVLFIALGFAGTSLAELLQRITQIKQTSSANNVRFYLHRDGVYLAQEDFDSLRPVPPSAGRPIRPEVGYYADIEHGSDLDVVETAYVRLLGTYLQPTPFVQLGSSGSTLGGAALNPATAVFSELERRVRELGGVYESSLLERFHIALNHLTHKHFVLLTGISGTGKTLLARTYAYALLGIASLKLSSGNFHLIPVRPDWTEPAHLLGFVDAVSGRYQRTRFVEALLQAHHNPAHSVFVCLDEMNLAQPEHYFADVLSAMESGEPIHLHHESQDVGVPQSIPWPDNLYIVGTVNMDETTRPFSPKVLDRANVIDMSAVDIDTFCTTLKAKTPVLAEVLDQALVNRLKRLSSILAPHGLHFGYRVIEEIAKYVAFAVGHALLADALDVQIEQKVLTKLRGGPEHEKMLTELREALKDLPRSAATIDRMRNELSLYDSFQFWR